MTLQALYQDVKVLSKHKVRNLGVCGARVRSLRLEKADHSPARCTFLSNSPPSQGGLQESQEQNEGMNHKDEAGAAPESLQGLHESVKELRHNVSIKTF